MSARHTEGWPLLLRLGLRRDRVLASVGIGVLVLMAVASAAATPALYTDAADRARAAESLNASPAIVALYGPILDVRSEGELAMTKMTVLYALIAAVLFVVVVRRHTRLEEESGRTELVGGTGVGRDAPLVAAVVEAVVLAVVLGAATALGAMAGGLAVRGSLAFGLMWTGSALVAVGVAAVCVQLSASARTCAGWAAAVLGAFFVVRAVGDTGPGWLSWWSPLGWNTRVEAYGDTRWWLLAAYPVLAAALVAAAAALRRRRDLGAGLLAARPGPATGSPRLRGAASLALRVHATALVLWSVAATALGAVFGAIAPGVGDLLDDPTARSIIDGLGGALISAILSIVAVVLTYFGVTVLAHTARDEDEGRAAVVLTTGVDRWRWFGAGVALALLGTTWLLLLTGTGLWVGYAAADGPAVGDIVLAALAWAPATWVVTALGVVALALGARWTALAWAWPGLFLTLSLLADLLRLPAWVTDLSPYAHVAALPHPWDWADVLALSAVAAALLVGGAVLVRRRDIA